MRIKRLAFYAALSAACTLLAACDIESTTSFEKPAGQSGVTVKGSITIKTSTLRGLMAQSLTAQDLHIDTAGTDFMLYLSGNVAVTLLDADGSVLSSRSFAWTRQGTQIGFDDLASVEAWADSYPTADSADYHLVAGSLPADGQDHYVSSALVVDGTPQSSASATFQGLGGGGCAGPMPNPRICRN